MDQFIIDRASGIAIWIDVVDGIVQKCYNEAPKYIKRLNELYKGKTISFLKQDFESKMSPVYHNVRPEAILSTYQKINAVSSRIRNNWNLISNLRTVYGGKDAEAKTAEQTARVDSLKAQIEAWTIEQSGYEKDLEVIKERLWVELSFRVK